MKNAIIIAIYGESECIDKCVESISVNTKIPYKLCVVNTLYPERISLSRAWNSAIKDSDCEIITVLNDDTIVSRGWLGDLNRALIANKDYGIVSPSTSVCANKKQRELYDSLKPKINTIADVDNFNVKIKEHYRHDVTEELGIELCGFCMTFKKETWENVGGFDEGDDYGVWAYGEDNDFCDRLDVEFGLKSIWLKNSYVHHIGRQTACRIPDLNKKAAANRFWERYYERREKKNKVVDGKIVIGGIGRTGTTMMMCILSYLELGTGFGKNSYLNENLNKTFFLEGRPEAYIFKENENAGLKVTRLEKYNIDHFILMDRDLGKATASRVKKHDYGEKFGGLTADTGWDKNKQMEISREKRRNLIHYLQRCDIPYTIINYPKCVDDKDYMYKNLLRVFPGINQVEFGNAFNLIVDDGKVGER